MKTTLLMATALSLVWSFATCVAQADSTDPMSALDRLDNTQRVPVKGKPGKSDPGTPTPDLAAVNAGRGRGSMPDLQVPDPATPGNDVMPLNLPPTTTAGGNPATASQPTNSFMMPAMPAMPAMPPPPPPRPMSNW